MRTTIPGPAHPDRITALDASNLRIEDHGVPMHVAALAFLDGAPLLDGAGELLIDRVRGLVDERSRRAARLRQVLVPSRRGAGPPAWQDDDAFDITRHVRVARVPAPGDEASLLALCGELNRPRLDRSHPLWQMWLLTGLVDGRVALLIRVHHVVADGIALLSLLGSLLDPGPGAEAMTPSSRPGTATPLGPGRLAPIVARAGVWARQVAAVARQGRAPALSVNRPVGERRRLVLVRADLEAARAVAHRHGGTINDVVLAAVAGGARRLLDRRGELSPGLVLQVSVAASVRRPDDAATGGNVVGVRVVPVPVGEPDAVTRLEAIAATTAAQRHRPPYQPSGRFLQRWMVRVMKRQRLVNLLVSNLPGPTVPLRFAGASVLEVFQVGVVQGNLALAVGVLSYAGQLNVDVIADADVVPDVDLFADGIAEALDQVGVLSRRAG